MKSEQYLHENAKYLLHTRTYIAVFDMTSNSGNNYNNDNEKDDNDNNNNNSNIKQYHSLVINTCTYFVRDMY